MELEVVIGLEIHAQLSTKSKMFCGCDNDAFGAEPNTRVCPICMGFPGTLPAVNAQAVQKGARAALVLGCELKPFSKFDRKNYFYPDLPMGFQISQYDQPISENGAVEIEVDGATKTVRITRLHLENDAGKLTHTAGGTLCDYNRAGSPLAEIVTEPDMRSPEQAVALAKEIQKIVRCTDASDADMEKGMMRFDASVSMRPLGDEQLYPRAEIKNLNSFTSLGKAIKYEIKRQRKLWEAGTPLDQEQTVGWLDDAEKTQVLRDKESANDYRYFPEPDLPPIIFTENEIAELKKTVPELPLARKRRYVETHGLAAEAAGTLADDPQLAEMFDEAAAKATPKKVAGLLLSTVLGETGWKQSQITPLVLSQTVKLMEGGEVSSSGGKEIVLHAMVHGGKAGEIMEQLGLKQNNDTGQLETWVKDVIAANPQSVEDIKAGKMKAMQFLMGQVMKVSRGAANPPMVMAMLRSELGVE